jgi:D-beta-D-heptose 7-phosphate kinase/D-beta-D-heptose 1-phosphate adenosyltransferase
MNKGRPPLQPMGKRIVWVNGCFDVLHLGHLKLLEFAKNQGDLLYVGLDADHRIKEAKGKDRPYNNWETRCEMMRAIRWVDDVSMFDTDYQLERLIEKYKPYTMVIGEEYKEKRIIGSQFCEKITFFPNYNNLSTTNFIENINKN